MRLIKKLLAPLTAAAAVYFFLKGYALADAAPPDPAGDPSSPQNIAMLWPMIAVALSGVWAYAQRKWFSTAGGWWHSDAGHIAIVAAGVVLDAITPTIQHYRGGFHGFPIVALAWAAIGGLINALAAANASVPQGQKAPMHPDNITARAAALLFPILFFVAGCGAAFDTAFKQCAKNAAPSAVVTDVTQVPSQVSSVLATNAAAGPIAAVLDGIAALYQDGEFLVSCAETAWQTTHTPTPVQADAIRQYEGKHPAAAVRARRACGPVPRVG